MSYFDLCIIAFSVSLDAFAVALCCGLAKHAKAFKTALLLGIFFGGFQALMPLLGWGILYPFAGYLKSIGPYVMLLLLNGIGGYMIYEAFSEDDDEVEKSKELTLKYLFFSGLAVSFDASGIGASLALNHDPVMIPAVFMGVFTFVISIAGYYIGRILGHFFEHSLEFIGGIAIMLIGWKMFAEAMGWF